MKNFKKIDFWISAVLIIGSVIFGFITMDGKFLYGYFVVGGWQLISMVIHWINKCFIEDKRSYYHKFVLILVIIVVCLAGIGQVINESLFFPLIVILYILMITSPLMAIYYTYMCYEETFIKMKRPMELLK